jgi:hypothetical protein
MWFHTLFNILLTRSSRTRSRKRGFAPSFGRRSRSFRPLLDTLEDRTLLSTYTVNSLADPGTGSGLAGSFRYCLTNATSGNDTITFEQGLTGTIQLQSALPALNASVAIQGPGAAALTVEIGAVPYVFFVASSATVEISGLTMSGPNTDIANAGTLTVSASIFFNNSSLFGGGFAITNSGTATVSDSLFHKAIDNTGTMTINNSACEGVYYFEVIGNHGVLTVNYSTVSDNYGGGIAGAYGQGGAFFNQGALTINNSTLNNNHVAGGASRIGTTVIGHDGMGGGIYMSAGTLSINSSTLEGNEAAGGGGGYPTSSSTGSTGGQGGNGQGGGLYIAGGMVSINNSTFADNHAYPGSVYRGSPGDSYGGGIYNAAGPSALQMSDTILAYNSAITAAPDLDGSVTSLGHNLIGNTQGASGFDPTDLLNVDPLLGPIQDNGGASRGVPMAQHVVQTMALLAGSPALNAGDPSQLSVPDQRGVIRTGGVNIGAYQASASTFVLSAPDTVQAGVPFDVTVAAVDPFGQPAVGYTGTVTFGTNDADPGVVLPAGYAFRPDDGGRHTFTDTGLGETTLITQGDQTLTVMDTSDNTIAGSASVTVNTGPGPEPHGQGSPPGAFQASSAPCKALPQCEPSASEAVVLERWFISFREGDSAWLTVPRLRPQARGQTDSGLADFLGSEDLLFA